MTQTFDLPDDLVQEAQKALGFDSASATVEFALREVVRRSRIGDPVLFVQTAGFEFDPTDVRRLDRKRSSIP